MHIVLPIFFIVFLQTIIPADLQALEVRRSRPSASNCDASGRCPFKDGYIEETDQRNPGNGKERPPVLTKDDHPAPVGVGRPGIGSDYKPIRDVKPPPVDHHNPKPAAIGGGHDIRSVGDGREPRGESTKPVRRGHGGSYRPRPDYDRDEYNPKPVRGGGQGHRGQYPKPDADDYDRRPVRNGGGYRPRPVHDEYKSRPGDKEYTLRQAGDYRPRPAGGGRDDYYPDSDEYNRREEDKKDIGGYDRPRDEEYDDEYESKGGSMDDSVGKDNKKCNCVLYKLCRDGRIVTDGSGLIDARKITETDKSSETFEDYMRAQQIAVESCGPAHVCCGSPETSHVHMEHMCGRRNPSGISNSRILSPSNYGEADFGEWPWQAAILKAEGGVNIFQCGGVLIGNYHVLTVAQCVYDFDAEKTFLLKVRLGEWDTQHTTEFLAHEDYQVSKIMIHPDFQNTSLWNDIALLRLEEDVVYGPHIGSVCLPKYDEVFDGVICVFTGWGQDAYKHDTFSNIMKEVSLQVIDKYKCEEMLRKTRLGRFFQLHEGFMCAGGEPGQDACKGDGGGPLVCVRRDKSYALAGLVSWGIDCGQPAVPGVYVKIQKYLDWISSSTGVSLKDYWKFSPAHSAH